MHRGYSMVSWVGPNGGTEYGPSQGENVRALVLRLASLVLSRALVPYGEGNQVQPASQASNGRARARLRPRLRILRARPLVLAWRCEPNMQFTKERLS